MVLLLSPLKVNWSYQHCLTESYMKERQLRYKLCEDYVAVTMHRIPFV